MLPFQEAFILCREEGICTTSYYALYNIGFSKYISRVSILNLKKSFFFDKS
jgi:hypothetical protein